MIISHQINFLDRR